MFDAISEFSERNLFRIFINPAKSPAERYDAMQWLNQVYKYYLGTYQIPDYSKIHGPDVPEPKKFGILKGICF